MSTVFASDVKGWEDEDPYGLWSNRSAFNAADLDENFGTPHHYVDIDDPSVTFVQMEYEKTGQREFDRNIQLVKDCMMSGILMPSKTVIPKMVDALKKIAGSSV